MQTDKYADGGSRVGKNSIGWWHLLVGEFRILNDSIRWSDGRTKRRVYDGPSRELCRLNRRVYVKHISKTSFIETNLPHTQKTRPISFPFADVLILLYPALAYLKNRIRCTFRLNCIHKPAPCNSFVRKIPLNHRKSSRLSSLNPIDLNWSSWMLLS